MSLGRGMVLAPLKSASDASDDRNYIVAPSHPRQPLVLFLLRIVCETVRLICFWPRGQSLISGCWAFR